ncbi:MAG: GyrI-like domain-containing protein [Meiothermus sp.]|nr:GyrI-like domain-containing protein [Meiothermus sp.]
MNRPYPTRESGFFVAGLETRTSPELEAYPRTAKVPALWQQFNTAEFYAKVPRKLAKEKPFVVYHSYGPEGSGAYSVTLGYQVPGLNDVAEGLSGLNVPPGRYLMFTAEGNPALAVPATWKGIQDYFKQPNAPRRAYTFDYEVHESTARVSIFIAVQ